MNLPFDLTKVDTLIFDFDGTLHDGQNLSLPIYQKCLSNLFSKFKLSVGFPSDEKILEGFGKQTPDIYYSLLNTKDKKILSYFGNCIESQEVTAFNEGKGKLYPNVEETLYELKKRGYELAICTNARVDYFDAVVQRFDLPRFFKIMYAAGYYPGKDKNWMVGEIIKQVNTKHFAVIGDRFHDIEAAKSNQGIAIGCDYGFGKAEVKNAHIIISEIKKLLSLF